MKKLIILAMVLVLMAMATTVLAIPGENSPWESVDTIEGPGNPDWCPHPSDPNNPESGVLYYNPNSGKTHCFKV